MKCNGCDKIARTKRGWCSIECYRTNQTQNSSWFKIDHIPWNFNPTKPIKKKRIKPINVIRNCVLCKNEFECLSNSKKKFCGKKCSINHVHENNFGKIRKPRISLICKMCGMQYNLPPSVAKNSKYCSRQCHNIGNVKNMKKNNTNIEIKLKELLCDIGVVFQEQLPLLKKTIADFVVNKIVIYADGNYWHSRPEVINRDKNITKLLIENGYKVLRFNETDILKYPNKVRTILLENLYEYK